MEAFLSGKYQGSHRQLQFPDEGILLFQFHVIGFHQGIPEIRHIFIPTSVPVQRIEADPRAGFRVVIPQHRANIAVAFIKGLDQLSGSPAPVPL